MIQFCVYKNIKEITQEATTLNAYLDKCFPTFKEANDYLSKMNEAFAYMRTEKINNAKVHYHTFYTIKEERLGRY
ncbi:hypothetical protein JN09_001177 [Acholeplasma morum]|jgi:hypothetical protein|uniref:hypothetical protein n=1 Tax=Paracholeplasma morum TaxID=264637 RepID=UPI00195A125C|nr:hypothetical protein [Paracholeplasma morum]MBM7453844.1 hypothetical protein [Paracholeplasma morum]